MNDEGFLLNSLVDNILYIQVVADITELLRISISWSANWVIAALTACSAVRPVPSDATKI